jgi:hypothetical protein
MPCSGSLKILGNDKKRNKKYNSSTWNNIISLSTQMHNSSTWKQQ